MVMFYVCHLVCLLLETLPRLFCFRSDTPADFIVRKGSLRWLLSAACFSIISRANEANWVERNAWATICPSCCSLFTTEYGVYCAWRWLVGVRSARFTTDFLVSASPHPPTHPAAKSVKLLWAVETFCDREAFCSEQMSFFREQKKQTGWQGNVSAWKHCIYSVLSVWPQKFHT